MEVDILGEEYLIPFCSLPENSRNMIMPFSTFHTYSLGENNVADTHLGSS